MCSLGVGLSRRSIQVLTEPNRVEGPDWRCQEHTWDGKTGASVQGPAIHFRSDPVGSEVILWAVRWYLQSACCTDVPDGVGGDLFRCSGSRRHAA
jgi:hypothetical protein